MKFTSLGR